MKIDPNSVLTLEEVRYQSRCEHYEEKYQQMSANQTKGIVMLALGIISVLGGLTLVGCGMTQLISADGAIIGAIAALGTGVVLGMFSGIFGNFGAPILSKEIAFTILEDLNTQTPEFIKKHYVKIDRGFLDETAYNLLMKLPADSASLVSRTTNDETPAEEIPNKNDNLT